MSKEAFLLQIANIKAAGVPFDANTPQTPVRVSMTKAGRMTVLVSMGASTAAVATFALKQHNAASSGTSKALEIGNPYFHKAGAATVWTKVEQADGVKEDTYDLSTLFAADGGMVAFEVLEEDLDVNGGFTHMSIEFADTTAAKIVAAVYIARGNDLNPSYDQAI